ncbi:MAG: hypothetical protein Q4C85_10565 [Actinomyces sp.]|uniref:hypothetical protein n=1 Tax=Actinomyces sp. TaxID=29317 RepID=UPI0026DAAF7C|nr:hypothetical protein [Actinomyces sp.]MDO4244181.1 hypothetical protein [Actinomyces sp.]
MTQDTAQPTPRPGPAGRDEDRTTAQELPDHGPRLDAAQDLPLGERVEELVAVHASLSAVLRQAQG